MLMKYSNFVLINLWKLVKLLIINNRCYAKYNAFNKKINLI